MRVLSGNMWTFIIYLIQRDRTTSSAADRSG
jgi:hypothetical protein